jgi:Protein of unknown function (DUF3311)
VTGPGSGLPQPDPPRPAAAPVARHSRWNWLLAVPVVAPLVIVLYNADGPRLLGFPRFYWLQLAFLVLGMATTVLVYQLTKRR